MEYVELYVAYILKVFVGFLILGTPGNGQYSSSSGFRAEVSLMVDLKCS